MGAVEHLRLHHPGSSTNLCLGSWNHAAIDPLDGLLRVHRAYETSYKSVTLFCQADAVCRQVPVLLRHHPGAVSTCSVAIASRLDPNELQGTLPSNPGRTRLLAAINAGPGNSTTRLCSASTALQVSAGDSIMTLIQRLENPCMNNTQPPVLPSTHIGPQVAVLGCHRTHEYTMKATNAIMLGAAPTGLDAAPHPASQTYILAPRQALDGLITSPIVKIWPRRDYCALTSKTTIKQQSDVPPVGLHAARILWLCHTEDRPTQSSYWSPPRLLSDTIGQVRWIDLNLSENPVSDSAK
ncbi:hypothetical protein C7974DRAFT_467892 [Boeremia exigua]|uniref:uncharacterized protein n=1 Tax=Boeremia exigua TaxID=749465 RepID=UPI001E8EF2BF|nr:uncharacterized protein C7974DRAFT_467892 [Boeremia exigua]KAH6644225.1 hypothetical protein C7974DRAFT_467892 [Boeremia exigua]